MIQEHPDQTNKLIFCLFIWSGCFFIVKRKVNSLEKKHVLFLKKNPQYGGVYLYEDDISFLKHLLLHQVMRTKNIIEFYLTLSDRNEVALSNRLSKLYRAGVLRREKFSISLYYYRVGNRGLKVLLELGHIQEADVKYYDKLTEKKSLSTHDDALSTLANKIYIQTQKKGYFDNLKHTPGYQSVLFGNNQNLAFEERNLIVPDWVFSNGDIHVCLEADTGSQRRGKISPKITRYVKRAEQLQAKNQKLIIIFSVIDDSVAELFPDNRERRISSLKENFPTFGSLPENLLFYVETASKTPNLVELLLLANNFKTLTEGKAERSFFSNDWLNVAEEGLSKDFEVTVIEKDRVFLPRRDKQVDFDLLLSLKERRVGGAEKYYAVIYGKSASLTTFQLIRTTGNRIEEINKTQQYPMIHILVVYDEEVYSVNDVYGLHLSCELWKTDTLTWARASKEAPKLLRYRRPYAKEWRYLGE